MRKSISAPGLHCATRKSSVPVVTMSLPIEFLAGLAHELRTPLSAIGGYAELMELGVHGPVTPAQVDGLQRIRRNQGLMVSLISAFMTYAEVATGSAILRPESVRLREVVAGALNEVAPRAHARSVRLGAVDLSSMDGLLVRADPDALRTLIDELLLDAVESSTAESDVYVEPERTPETVRLRVVSSGDAIASEAAEAVFMPFDRAGKGSRVSASPHALSLPTARAIARAFGGDVVAVPSPLTRSLVLTLPLDR